jgi:hypothetical protein
VSIVAEILEYVKELILQLLKSVGNGEKDCHAFNLMRESTSNMYRI